MTDPYWRNILTAALAIALLVATVATYYLVRYPNTHMGSYPVILDRANGHIISGIGRADK